MHLNLGCEYDGRMDPAQIPSQPAPPMPTVTPPPAPPSQKKSMMLPLVVTVIVTAILVGTAMYLLVNAQSKSKEILLGNQVSDLQAQIADQKAASQSAKQTTAAETSQLLKTKFSLDILRFWKVEQVFQSPSDPNVFVFIGPRSGISQDIRKFDATNIPNYLQSDRVDLTAYMTYLIKISLAQDEELRGVGIDQGHFVFYKAPVGDSPGPCHSDWLVSDLNYIDISSPSAQAEAYTISEEKRQAEQQKQVACQQEIDKGQ